MTNSIAHTVRKTIEASFKSLTDDRCALLFTGGFDSVLLAVLLRQYGADFIAVTVQFDDFNPRTINSAISIARKMDLPHYIVYVSLSEFLSAFKELPPLIDRPISDLDLVVTHAAFKNYDPNIAGTIFVSGMGSDQVLGDISFNSSNIDEANQYQVARMHGYKIIFPFLSEGIMSLSNKISQDQKKDKKLLKKILSDNHKVFIPKSFGQREIQVPIQVRDLLVKIYGKGKYKKADEKILEQIFKDLWIKTRRD